MNILYTFYHPEMKKEMQERPSYGQQVTVMVSEENKAVWKLKKQKWKIPRPHLNNIDLRSKVREGWDYKHRSHRHVLFLN